MSGLLRDAGWGAAVTVVLSVLPFSPVVGGAVASHRRGCRYATGVAVGLLSGVVAAIPLLALFVPTLLVVGWLGYGVPPSSPAYDLFLAIVFGLFGIYTVGLSGVGGLGGVWARLHTDWDLDPARWL
ncbi:MULTISPECIES: DUF5518 domain-containing protein [Halomicrobium]|uniref:DUF5518 domain-containing protein n=2 Tax=Halomicrobium mukohataei TaxID=57705 RepID=C7NZ18_HALMD|nr:MULTISPECIES: DUF5518 domain-containing protein [Halomicrobium]ACV48707.1 conserved hypothetical protein [Halomicrobium mukohataei DSM 12286]QCD64139.1 hypothetical protein E5139_00290 [Halomicrobium mukohataei]QFR18945.1 hypothetical protein GBQ70_00290 [Halomicrobium sp. ZPS1]